MTYKVKAKTNKYAGFKVGETHKAFRPNKNTVLVWNERHTLLIRLAKFYENFTLIKDDSTNEHKV